MDAIKTTTKGGKVVWKRRIEGALGWEHEYWTLRPCKGGYSFLYRHTRAGWQEDAVVQDEAGAVALIAAHCERWPARWAA